MHSTTSPLSSRARRLVWGASVLIVLALCGFALQQSLAAATDIFPPTSDTGAAGSGAHPSTTGSGSVVAPSEADGVIRDGDQPTPFDTDRVAVGNLDPALLEALQRAASDAAASGVSIVVNSGWRSTALQQHLLDEAVATYGSIEEAARWVATPETSLHVSGDAVDLGPLPAIDWLTQHGADYGLCQTYGNETWHFELRPDAVADGCPEKYDNPAEDPRLQG